MRGTFFLLLVITFLIAVMPDSEAIKALPVKNYYVLHFLAFAVFAICIDLGYPTAGNVFKVLVLVAYGLLIEGAQHFVPYRTCSFWDVVADAAGISVYFILVRGIMTRLARKTI